MSTRPELDKVAQMLSDTLHGWDYNLEDRPYNGEIAKTRAEQKLGISNEITRPLDFIRSRTPYTAQDNRIKTESRNPKADRSLYEAVRELDFEHLGYHPDGRDYEFESPETAENVEEIAREIEPDPAIKVRTPLYIPFLMETWEEEPYKVEQNTVSLNSLQPKHVDALDTAAKILHDGKYYAEK